MKLFYKGNTLSDIVDTLEVSFQTIHFNNTRIHLLQRWAVQECNNIVKTRLIHSHLKNSFQLFLYLILFIFNMHLLCANLILPLTLGVSLFFCLLVLRIHMLVLTMCLIELIYLLFLHKFLIVYEYLKRHQSHDLFF